jgi:hypothetical protein
VATPASPVVGLFVEYEVSLADAFGNAIGTEDAQLHNSSIKLVFEGGRSDPAGPVPRPTPQRTVQVTSLLTCSGLIHHLNILNSTYALLALLWWRDLDHHGLLRCIDNLAACRRLRYSRLSAATRNCTQAFNGYRFFGAGFYSDTVDDHLGAGPLADSLSNVTADADACALWCQETVQCVKWLFSVLDNNCHRLTSAYTGTTMNGNYTSGLCLGSSTTGTGAVGYVQYHACESPGLGMQQLCSR